MTHSSARLHSVWPSHLPAVSLSPHLLLLSLSLSLSLSFSLFPSLSVSAVCSCHVRSASVRVPPVPVLYREQTFYDCHTVLQQGPRLYLFGFPGVSPGGSTPVLPLFLPVFFIGGCMGFSPELFFGFVCFFVSLFSSLHCMPGLYPSEPCLSLCTLFITSLCPLRSSGWFIWPAKAS